MKKLCIEIENLFHIMQIILFTFAVELLLSTILFLFGISIAWYFFFVSFAISTFLCYFINENVLSWPDILLSLAIIMIISWNSGYIFDYSWDGNMYHKLAVGLLKNGWNPLQSTPEDVFIQEFGIQSNGNTLWVETYGKATWIFGAEVYSIFGNIETGKSYTMISMVCVFFLVIYYMRKKEYSILEALMMACVSAINPIATQQMATYYIDGFLYEVLMILIIALLMMEDQKTFDPKVSASIIAAAMIVCGNAKFTGLLYGGIFCIAYYLYDFFRNVKKRKEDGIRRIVRESIFYLALVIMTVVWAGGSTYITNLIRHGSPIYPLTGAGKVDFLSASSPFYEENHIKNLFLSLFSKVDNFFIGSGKTPELKIPFTFDKNEIRNAMGWDPRISGFGILFGGLLIISAAVIIIWAISSERKLKKKLILLNIFVCLGLTFGIKESWWARYAPYIYLLIVISTYILIDSNRKMIKIMSCAATILILINNTVPIYKFFDYTKSSRKADAYFRDLKDYRLIEISNRDFEGVYYNFIDYDIHFRVNNSVLDDETANTTNYMGTKWIVAEK